MSKEDVIKTQMRKFSKRIENAASGETSLYGLNTANVSISVIDDEDKSFEYIRDNLWLELFDEAGENTATLLLQLYIGSRDSLFDILRCLRQAVNPGEAELSQWLRQTPDLELAEKLSYAMLNFYMNWSDSNEGCIECLKAGSQLGFGLARITPRMSDAEIENYNSNLGAGSVYWLRTNAELALETGSGFTETAPEVAPEADSAGNAAESKDWVKLLIAFGAGFALCKIANYKQEAK